MDTLLLSPPLLSLDHASLESECERESVCSDSSWIITPGPTFRGTGQQVSTEVSHPLENLLIEHPTMSVYGQVPGEGNGNREELREEAVGEAQQQRQADTSERDLQRMRNQTQEMVLLRNRQRYQVAVHLQLPLQTAQVDAGDSAASAKPPLRMTKKGTRRLNLVKHRNTRGKQTYHIKKSTFVAGRRRC